MLCRMPTRRAHFWSEFICWVDGYAASAAWNFIRYKVGREMVRLGVLMSHPRTHFLSVHAALAFLIFFRVLVYFRIVSPGTLGRKTLSITWKM